MTGSPRLRAKSSKEPGSPVGSPPRVPERVTIHWLSSMGRMMPPWPGALAGLAWTLTSGKLSLAVVPGAR
jgi:hypothetical protein